MATRVGMLGLGRIGYVQARHFRDLGAEIVAVLCSSRQSTKASADKLSKDFGFNASDCDNLETFFSHNLDAVSICTPPSLHFDQIKVCLDKNIPIFCEKPLFWNDSLTADVVYEQINSIRNHENRRLFVNTSNTVFLDALIKSGRELGPFKSFSFEFYTTGEYEGVGIAEDLFPHGLSLLIRLLGESVIANFVSNVSDHSFQCQFQYAECLVTFDFRENPMGFRHMRLGLNDNFYTRIQAGESSSYSVSLENNKTKEIFHVEDPFRCYISKFLNFVNSSGSKANDEFPVAALNLTLMSQCLLKSGDA